MKVTVLGSGAWGTALALLLLENGNQVAMWSHHPAALHEIRTQGENPKLPGVPVPERLELAEDMSCVIISSPHDTYTIARLINQSIPIKYLMTKDNLITFHTSDKLGDIKEIMRSSRHRDYPIINRRGKYIGTISRRNLIGNRKKQVILVDHNEKSQAADNIEEANILEIIDHHRLGSLETMAPVLFRNQPVGCTATIMYQIYQERNLEIPQNIAGLLCAAIISDTLLFRSPTCTTSS